MDWFYLKDGEQFGPVPAAELTALIQGGAVGPDDLVWREGMEEWTPAALASLGGNPVPVAQHAPGSAYNVEALADELPAGRLAAAAAAASSSAEALPADAVPDALAEADANFRSGAQWYYWIAGLSLVNIFLWASGSDVYFVLGLGVSMIVNGVGIGLEESGMESGAFIATAINLVITAAIAAIGWFSLKRIKVIYIIGMAFYALDTLIFIIFFDLLPLLIHLFALYCLFNGFRALLALEQVLPAPAAKIDSSA